MLGFLFLQAEHHLPGLGGLSTGRHHRRSFELLPFATGLLEATRAGHDVIEVEDVPAVVVKALLEERRAHLGAELTLSLLWDSDVAPDLAQQVRASHEPRGH